MLRVKRILAATDFSAYSKEALDYAVYLAKPFAAEVFLLHVFQNPYLSASVQMIALVEQARAEDSKRLQALAADVRNRGIKVSPIFKEGVRYEQILRAAAEVKADIIVLGTHGRSGLAHVMLGSVAERVVRMASCPVLTVRPRSLAKRKR